jgi:multidrug efflux pump subunit AcrB
MRTFAELTKDIEELRVINVAQRRKIARRMKRLAKSSAFQKKKERAKLKIASPEKQAVKARKAAKKIIINKFFKNYDKLSPQMKMKVDQRIAAKYGNAINKIAQRMKIRVKKGEIEKVKAARAARQAKQSEK